MQALLMFPITRNSMQISVKSQDHYGSALYSFCKLMAFCDPIQKTIFILHPIPWKSVKRHLSSWMTTLKNEPAFDGIGEFKIDRTQSETIEAAFSSFLRSPEHASA